MGCQITDDLYLFVDMQLGPEGDDTYTDVAADVYSITLERGNDDGGITFPPDTITIELRDNDLTKYTWRPGEFVPGRLVRIRYNVTDPYSGESQVGGVLAVALIEQVFEEHRPPANPRIITVQCVHMMRDLVTDWTGQDVFDTAWKQKTDAVLDDVGWRWLYINLPDGDPNDALLADRDPQRGTALDRVRQICANVGYAVIPDKNLAALQVVRWPGNLNDWDNRTRFVDCWATAGDRVAQSIRYGGSYDRLLNRVVFGHRDDYDGGYGSDPAPDPQISSAIETDAASIAAYGERSIALGFPMSGGLWTTSTGLPQPLGMVRAARDLFKDSLDGATSFRVSTDQERIAWFLMTRLDIGHLVNLIRDVYYRDTLPDGSPGGLEYRAQSDSWVCGYTMTIEPGRVVADVSVLTLRTRT